MIKNKIKCDNCVITYVFFDLPANLRCEVCLSLPLGHALPLKICVVRVHFGVVQV